MAGLFDELKRRNVFKVGAAYVVMAWLLAQGVDVFLENFGAPDWVIKTTLLLLVAGFPLALFFAWAFELTPEGIKKEKDVDRSQSITHETGRKLDFVIIGILLLALTYFAIDKFVPGDDRPGVTGEDAVSVEQQASSAAAEAGTKSIAVLPFVNMSEDAGNEFFSDGISEEILNALAKVHDLKVAGRTSSFAFKGQNQDLRVIGEALGVDHILEGSVRKAGNTVRVTAQLIQVDDGFHLWSESYDRELNDIFAIQDEIAGAILEQLKTHLIGEEITGIVATRTNTEAYELYLLAKQRMYERTGPTIQAAADLLDRALAIDPAYAPAYAQRAIATMLLAEGSGSYGNLPREQVLSQSSLYLDKALELDPELGEAWAAKGLYHLNGLTGADALQAIEALEKALVLNPAQIDASNWLNNALMAIGRPDRAREVVNSMVERDPLYRPGIRNAINNYIFFGEQEKALAHLERIRPLIPNDAVIQSSMAGIYNSLGEAAKAQQMAEAAVALQPSNSVARLTLSFALANTLQYERLASEGEEWLPVIALQHLGRVEEASLLALKRAEEVADVGTLFAFLNTAGRSPELVSYLEERWPDLDALRADFPPYAGLGDFLMLDVALAYQRTGNQARYEQALAMAAEVQDGLEAAGVNFFLLWMNQASRWALAGDLEKSLVYLDRAISQGLTANTRIVRDWPALEPLEGDPRFEAMQQRMIEHINSERQKLGLEPVST